MKSPLLSKIMWASLALFVFAACKNPPADEAGQAESGEEAAQVAEGVEKAAAGVESQPKADAPADPVVLLPAGEPPEEGWPMVVMLHGYRSSERDFVPVGKLAADRGMVAISLPAPLERGEGHYHWKQGQPEHTHDYVQQTLGRLAEGKAAMFDAERVWLAGFSQGALHSMHLAAKHPKAYRGVLAISPAGWADVPAEIANPEVTRDFVLVGGRSEKADYRETFFATRDLLADAGMPLEIIEHDKGHQFPPNWQKLFAGVFDSWGR